jgi:N-ethylmaleimide reductase
MPPTYPDDLAMTMKLLQPITLGRHALDHRIVMAPLTRMRAEQPGDRPGALMTAYYRQRASKNAFMVSEATVVSPDGNGYLGSPGLYDDAQVPGWKAITDAVHAKGGVIFLQLFHAGRQSHVKMQPGGGAPVAPSVVAYEGLAYTEDGWVPSSPHRALTEAEVVAMVEQFRRAAVRGLAAGFDGVEIHGANGYLVDQFLQDGSNHRDDAFGGDIPRRVKFLVDVTRAAISVWGADRVGVRLGPSGTFGDMHDSNPTALFSYAATVLDELGIAYLHLIEPRVNGNAVDATKDQAPLAARLMRQYFHGTIIAAGGFEVDTAEAILQEGSADLVAFGRHYIANPDLPARIARGLPLAPHDRETFYGGDAHGYTDYPAYA